MQKITPFLWFEGNAEQAIDFYISLFENSKLVSIDKYPDFMPEMAGKVLTGVFELNGKQFMAIDGGPMFKLNPAISFFVNLQSEQKLDELWNKLADGGKALMPYDKYPFAEKYGWVQDKYGVSWQISLTKEETKIVPSLMFTHGNFGKAEEAMNFYTSLFDNSKLGMIARYGEEMGDQAGKISYAEFILSGLDFKIMENNGDHDFNFSEAISLYVDCVDQVEVDKLWNSLIADGGEESQCGWLKDKYGVSWQIIPRRLPELLKDKDRDRANKAMQAMLQMKKIDVSELEKAYNS
jgi:predicted 3-demethylubiquinone-9 3-methyltransferase (glyoxalase superfamily)